MYIYIYMYVCLHVFICMHVCMCMHTYVYIDIQHARHASSIMCVHVCECVCVINNVCACMSRCARAFADTLCVNHIDMRAGTRARAFTLTHKHKRIRVCVPHTLRGDAACVM